MAGHHSFERLTEDFPPERKERVAKQATALKSETPSKGELPAKPKDGDAPSWEKQSNSEN